MHAWRHIPCHPDWLVSKIEWGLFMLNKSAMLRLTFAAASLMGAANLALADTATANLAVTASVSKSCTISTTALAFGAYDPIGANATAALNGSGAVSVACSKNSTGLTIGLGNGANASGTQRQLAAADGQTYCSTTCTSRPAQRLARLAHSRPPPPGTTPPRCRLATPPPRRHENTTCAAPSPQARMWPQTTTLTRSSPRSTSKPFLPMASPLPC